MVYFNLIFIFMPNILVELNNIVFLNLRLGNEKLNFLKCLFVLYDF
jgi:hypothetical protein